MGRIEADAAREAVLDLVRSHDGPFFVIDGFLSDEMSPRDEELVNAALERASGNGFPAGRLWGCDSGAPPFAGWSGFRTGGGGFIFEGQEAAAADLARSLPDDPVLVTGAWAGTNTNTGCVNSVVPVCMAKTQYSFTTDPDRRGAPTGFTIPVRDLRLSAGAGFVVAICGETMTMPGLPRVPAAETIGIDGEGHVAGLF